MTVRALRWLRPRRASVPAAPRPDCALIDRLERDLGLAEPAPDAPEPARRRPRPPYCLRKGCAGGTHECRTMSGRIVARVHYCE